MLLLLQLNKILNISIFAFDSQTIVTTSIFKEFKGNVDFNGTHVEVVENQIKLILIGIILSLLNWKILISLLKYNIKQTSCVGWSQLKSMLKDTSTYLNRHFNIIIGQ